MNVKKAICLGLVILLIIGIIFIINSPPIGKSEKGIDSFNRYNRFVLKCLSEKFEMWNALSPDERFISDHYYRYYCAIAGDPTFLISFEMQFDKPQDYKTVCQQVTDVYPVAQKDDSLKICGNASDDYQWFFDSDINDGRYVYLEYSIMDEENLNIQFVFALLYDEMEKDERIIDIAKTGYALVNN